MLFDVMGFGTRRDSTQSLLQSGVLSIAWCSVLRQLAAGLGASLDAVDERAERLPAPVSYAVRSGTIEAVAAGVGHGARPAVDHPARVNWLILWFYSDWLGRKAHRRRRLSGRLRLAAGLRFAR